MNKTYFSKILAELMQEHKVNQLELAEAIYVRQSTIHNWLFNNRKPSYNCIKSICNYFNVSADMIVDTKFDD